MTEADQREPPERCDADVLFALSYQLRYDNPFGRNAFTRGKKSKVIVKQGQSLRLRWATLLHSEKGTEKHNAQAAYLDSLKQSQSDAR